VIALLKDGDKIKIDAENGTIDVLISDDEIAQRRLQFKAREHDYTSGALWKYTQTVGSAKDGATTHRGAKFEKISYDKI
ncbi:MAG: dihydroxy-acid dehydratase, partial [Alphaproteobacteria bacterium]